MGAFGVSNFNTNWLNAVFQNASCCRLFFQKTYTLLTALRKLRCLGEKNCHIFSNKIFLASISQTTKNRRRMYAHCNCFPGDLMYNLRNYLGASLQKPNSRETPWMGYEVTTGKTGTKYMTDLVHQLPSFQRNGACNSSRGFYTFGQQESVTKVSGLLLVFLPLQLQLPLSVLQTACI